MKTIYNLIFLLIPLMVVFDSKGQKILSRQDTIEEYIKTKNGIKIEKTVVFFFYVDTPFVGGSSPKTGIVITPRISLDNESGKKSTTWVLETEHEIINEGYPTLLSITFDDEDKTKMILPEFHTTIDGTILYYVSESKTEYLKKYKIKMVQVINSTRGVLLTVIPKDSEYFIKFYNNL